MIQKTARRIQAQHHSAPAAREDAAGKRGSAPGRTARTRMSERPGSAGHERRPRTPLEQGPARRPPSSGATRIAEAAEHRHHKALSDSRRRDSTVNGNSVARISIPDTGPANATPRRRSPRARASFGMPTSSPTARYCATARTALPDSRVPVRRNRDQQAAIHRSSSNRGGANVRARKGVAAEADAGEPKPPH